VPCHHSGVIDVMLSSTISDLRRDREAIAKSLSRINLLNFLGIQPVEGPSYGRSPLLATVEMAEVCHLYILLIGEKYGFVSGQGKSATEMEYDAAYRDDPTKILIFCKEADEREPAQQEFVRRVGEYHRGYYMRSYRDTYELAELAGASVVQWLEERAAIGRKLEYFDHFIRLAVQKSPFPGVRPTYRVDEDHIELKYRILGRSFTVHFDKALIYNDFWGCMASLESRFDGWRRESYGRRA
jgi:hypothetical protein